jgi:hypothetical protein
MVITCECGSTLKLKSSLKRHLTTKKHQVFCSGNVEEKKEEPVYKVKEEKEPHYGVKQIIINLFNNNVKNVEICLANHNARHCGKEGHWLEKQFGINHSGKNEPDIYGYELKKHSRKITLGDFSASEYLFSTKRTEINAMNNWTDEMKLDRSKFIKIFGNPNPNKDNRHSWSGICVPSYNKWNFNGQMLNMNENNDIFVTYSFSKDKRRLKCRFPEFLQHDNIVIVLWKSDKMRAHIEDKFNKRGFFICKKIGDTYQKICFGRPFNYDYFISCIKNGKIIFDSGMYEGNTRNYSHFRATDFWNDLIIEEY